MATRRPRRSASSDPPWMKIALPRTRALQVYALDPGVSSDCDNRVTIHVPWEDLAPGPAGRKVAVVDYDANNDRYYPPVDLDHPALLARHGLDPTESDPRFHQQMVYAVASRTIEMFEVALGRGIHWRRAERDVDGECADARWRKTGDIRVLNLYPHALHEPNAYYSPDAHGILFGYFTADATNPGPNLPGERIFTCLSHDIIAHETTHAIIDGIRTHFTEPTNPDVLAFHEGFADLAALFSHFSLEDTLIDAIRRTGGQFFKKDFAGRAPPSTPTSTTTDEPGDGVAISAQLRQVNPLIQLALQFGQAQGGSAGLRSAIGTRPDPSDIHTRTDDSHFRGSILVSAVFDAYFTVYLRRAEDLFAIYRAGGGDLTTDDLPEPLARCLAATAAETASFFFKVCARALDYCPPVDLTFGDFLRALVTVTRDLQPDDHDAVCDSLLQAFRRRGIYPEGAGFFSENALVWPRVPEGSVPPVEGLRFGNPAGMSTDDMDHDGDLLRAWANANREVLGLDPDLPVAVPSFHPMFRVKEDGRTHVEMIVELVQSTPAALDPLVDQSATIPFRGGATVVIEGPETLRRGGRRVVLAPEVRFVIGKPMTGDGGQQRLATQRAYALRQGFAFGGSEGAYQANFALVHEGR